MGVYAYHVSSREIFMHSLIRAGKRQQVVEMLHQLVQLPQKLVKSYTYHLVVCMSGSRGSTGGPGPPPLKNDKNIRFFSNIDPVLLKNYNCAKPAFIVGPSSARQ